MCLSLIKPCGQKCESGFCRKVILFSYTFDSVWWTACVGVDEGQQVFGPLQVALFL